MNLMSLPGSHTVRTPWHVLSAAMVQASAWRSSNGTVQTEKVHALTAVGTPMARQPCSVVSCEPVSGAPVTNPMNGVLGTMGGLG